MAYRAKAVEGLAACGAVSGSLLVGASDVTRGGARYEIITLLARIGYTPAVPVLEKGVTRWKDDAMSVRACREALAKLRK